MTRTVRQLRAAGHWARYVWVLVSGTWYKRTEEEVACPEWIYVNRNQVERLWARLKEWRAIATRYEKTASSFMGVLCLAATLDWLKP